MDQGIPYQPIFCPLFKTKKTTKTQYCKRCLPNSPMKQVVLHALFLRNTHTARFLASRLMIAQKLSCIKPNEVPKSLLEFVKTMMVKRPSFSYIETCVRLLGLRYWNGSTLQEEHSLLTWVRKEFYICCLSEHF